MTDILAMTPIRLVEAGLPGESMAAIARRTGAFGVVPGDSDAQVLEKFADWAIEENPGFKGDKGDPGSAGEGYPARSALATAGNAATDLDDAYLTEPGFEGKFVFSTDDLSAEVAADPDRRNYVAQADTPDGSDGAWVRQSAASLTFSQAGAGAVIRSNEDKGRELTSPQDFGAIGNGVPSATEHVGFEAALNALKNADDAFFNKALAVPTGVYYLTAPVDLAQSVNRIHGAPNALIRGAADEHVFRADGASFVSSHLSELTFYGGLDGVHAGTAGEIAQLTFNNLDIGAYTGTALYFAGGLTSSRFNQIYINGVFSTSGSAIHCDGGLNNNNVIADSDIFNVSGDVVRVENQAHALQIRNVHIEGDGQAGAAQYHLEAPNVCHIIGGWSEASHEYLVRTTAQADPRAAGVIIDGLASVGSIYGGGGFVGSKFDTGTNRIVLGSNYWAQATTAPAQCFIYGVNRNLLTNDSTVWTRDTSASFQLTTQAKRTAGTTRTLALTFNRPNVSAATSNQQVATTRVRVNFGVLNPSGTYAHGAIEWNVTIRGAGAAISAPMITMVTQNDGYSGASVTATCTAGTPGTTQVVVTVTIGALHATEPGFLQAEIEGTSSSNVEADRFVLSVA